MSIAQAVKAIALQRGAMLLDTCGSYGAGMRVQQRAINISLLRSEIGSRSLLRRSKMSIAQAVKAIALQRSAMLLDIAAPTEPE